MNVKKIVDIALLPGIVNEEAGMLMLPLSSRPTQNKPPRLAVCKAKGPPFAEPPLIFQATVTSETVTASCGFVIVRYIPLVEKVIEPVVI